MRFNRRRAALLATIPLAALSLTALPATAASAPAATVSRYVPLAGTSADATAARNAGCEEGKTGRGGVRILFFGTQEKNNVLRHPGTRADSSTPRVPAAQAAAFAAQWAEGFTSCRTGTAQAILALGVNNKSDGGVGGADAGRAWARVVEDAAKTVPAGPVSIAAAFDAEPVWSDRAWARGWVDAFTGATSRTLYAANSADGCPGYGSSSTSCSNGWSLADLHYVATGADPSIRAIPQIYRTDGIQARQWAAISAWGARSGKGNVRFVGAMSQRKACEQRGGCSTTNNTPQAAWTQLYEELNSHSDTKVAELPYSTDMRWP
ncbi:hypothetical protein ACQEU5_21780 [Marinactinospora thermotolerans]|uniref:hypothetical protein n=1 Tax=Marinactinospora thermotolerans TaxID=531310 RepID=UPI003D8F4564